jgi:hypothetical protein
MVGLRPQGAFVKRFRPLLISVLLALVAFGLARLDAAIRAAPPVMGGTAGDVLYASMFDAPSADMETFDGRLSAVIDGGILKIDVGDVQSAPFVPVRWHFADFDLRVVAAAVGGPVENAYGVVFRMRDARNYYRFVITSDGYYQLTQAVNGVEREISTFIPSDAILTDFGAGNTIRVLAQGDTFRFWVNEAPLPLCLPDDPAGASTYSGGECFGTMADAYTDGMHETGRIGLIGVSGMEPDVSVVFENLVVVQP